MKKFLIITNIFLSLGVSLILIKAKGVSVKEIVLIHPESVFEILTFIAFVNGSRFFLNFLIPGLLFFGTVQFVIMPFEGEYLLYHLEHLVMTLSAVYIIFTTIIRFQFLRFILGVIFGIIFLSIYVLFFQLDFFKKNVKYLSFAPYIEKVIGRK